MRVSAEEMVASVLLPHFDAVRDIFAAFSPEPGIVLDKAARVRFVIDDKIRDKPRHFAATTEDGLRMFFAPQIVDQAEETLVAIVAHEFGHAVDFLYPCRWISPPDGPGVARWITAEDEERVRRSVRLHNDRYLWPKLWRERNADHVEWAADGIAEAVTGKKIVYKGPCVLQAFTGGIERPVGLR